jgi:hypothetical protein
VLLLLLLLLLRRPSAGGGGGRGGTAAAAAAAAEPPQRASDARCRATISAPLASVSAPSRFPQPIAIDLIEPSAGMWGQI